MRHDEFAIGKDFMTNAGRWRCTDIGTRTITAIYIKNCLTNIDRDPSWFIGPPYAVAEHVFDEDSVLDCRPCQEDDET